MAKKVKVLPDSLANKIAAGEVIERPASVVKELVENALDAGSSEIEIIVQSGGKVSIDVRDNGEGMEREDALLSIERHATSKIRKAEDLFAINSLGFRGEALPSVAAVSRMELITKVTGALAGTCILLEGGRIKEIREAGCPEGTRVVVKDLFFSVPARKKFLRSTNTEAAHIHETLLQEAMAHWRVGFRYVHGNRSVIDTSPADSAINRITDLLGLEIASQIYPVQGEAQGVKLEGFLSHPNLLRSSTSGIYLMVNGRSIQDRAVVSALFQGYHPLLPKRRYPIAILFLNIPHDDVDINVHPSKKEVRFRNSQGIYELLVRSVRAFLREEPWIPRSQPVSNRKEEEDSIEGREGFLIREEPKGYLRGLTPTSTMDRSSNQKQLSLMGEKGFFSNLHYIGQIEATYLLLASPRGLLLIDQHAAHERVLFEKIKRGRLIKKSIVQPLLMPLSIDLSLRESSLLESYLPYLREVGVEVSPFGGNTWRITALPYWHEKGDGEKVIQDLIAEFMEMGHSVSVEDAMEKVLAVLACHGAIRANNGLQREEVIELLREMDSTPSAGRCPHGRPTYIEIDRQELERRFGRQK